MLRAILRLFGYLVGGFAVLAVALATLFHFAFQPSRDEVAAASSPDGRLVARLIEINGGATTSFGYTVVLSESGLTSTSLEVASIYGAVRNDSAYGANLRWESDTDLTIEFLRAKSSELKDSKPKLAGREVNVALRPNVIDASAPAGGMLYNLNGRSR